MPTNNGIEFPIYFPVSFNKTSKEGMSFPVKFPMTFYSSVEEDGMRFPVSFPFVFTHEATKRDFTVKIPVRCTADTEIYHGVSILPYKETACGKTTSIKFNETAWWFPGLFLEENIITEAHSELNITENIQSLILADFELESSNRVKVSWYGNTVPSLSIMKKSDADEEYMASETYGWDVGEAYIDIAGEDYNVYLRGSSNSGTSAIYTIGGISDVLVVPEVEVLMNEKIYDLEIDNPSKYHIVINY